MSIMIPSHCQNVWLTLLLSPDGLDRLSNIPQSDHLPVNSGQQVLMVKFDFVYTGINHTLFGKQFKSAIIVKSPYSKRVLCGGKQSAFIIPGSHRALLVTRKSSVLEMRELRLVFDIISTLIHGSHLLQFTLTASIEIFNVQLQQGVVIPYNVSMSIQKINFHLPDRSDISNMLVSRPCLPIVFPESYLQEGRAGSNNRPSIVNSIAPHYTTTNPMSSNRIVFAHSIVPPYISLASNQPSPSYSIFNQSASSAGKYVDNPRAVTASNQTIGNRSYSPVSQALPHSVPPMMQSNSGSHSHSMIRGEEKFKVMRPKSPKIQFKYVSPPKEKDNANNRQLSQIKQLSNESQFQVQSSFHEKESDSKNSVSPFSQSKYTTTMNNPRNPQSHTAGFSKTQITKSQQLNKTFGKEAKLQNRNSISNLIYLAEEKQPLPEDHEVQIQNNPSYVLQTVDKKENDSEAKDETGRFQSKEVIHELGATNQNSRQIEAKPIQVQEQANTLKDTQYRNSQKLQEMPKNTNMEQEQNRHTSIVKTSSEIKLSPQFLADNETKRDEESASRIKMQDEELTNMQKYYENLKYYNENGGQYPRVQKNSSDEYDDEESKDSRRNSSSRLFSNSKKDVLYQGTFGYLPEPIKQQSISQQEAKQQQIRRQSASKHAIREESLFLIQGIQNVKSQVFEGKILHDEPIANSNQNASRKKMNQNEHDEEEFNHKNQELVTKLRQKQLEIKNLKNQVWLMKLRENELMTTVKKLQTVNRDQEGLIQKLRSRQH